MLSTNWYNTVKGAILNAETREQLKEQIADYLDQSDPLGSSVDTAEDIVSLVEQFVKEEVDEPETEADYAERVYPLGTDED